ncbi:MAG: 50S ribosomal protein L10 [Candidatus Omnitrophota bacterium]
MTEEKKIGNWKELMILELTEDIKKANNFFISDYIGLGSEEMNEFRRELETSSSRYIVLKNSIAKIALDSAGFGDLKKHVTGGTGIVYADKDPAAAAKVIYKFGKTHKYLQVKGGYLEGNIVDAEKINYLASLPSRDELIAKVVYGLKAPISGFVGVLGNTIKSLIYVMQAIKEKRKTA